MHRAEFSGEDTRDAGILAGRSLDFSKVEAGTDLRILYYDSFRAIGTCQWEILVNGAACADPGRLWHLVSVDLGVNHHRSHLIGGVCRGVPAGNVTISVDVTGGGDCHTGHSPVMGYIEASEIDG